MDSELSTSRPDEPRAIGPASKASDSRCASTLSGISSSSSSSTSTSTSSSSTSKSSKTSKTSKTRSSSTSSATCLTTARDEEKPLDKKPTDADLMWDKVSRRPEDFNTWTLLLSHVVKEEPPNVDFLRKVFDTFLSLYPYCYNYWLKWADLEVKAFGVGPEVKQVFEKGVKAFPLSIELWNHYITVFIPFHTPNKSEIAGLFERALTCCGLHFGSSLLWKGHISWLQENDRALQVIPVYKRLFRTPIKELTSHFADFLAFVDRNHPRDILPEKEYLRLAPVQRRNGTYDGHGNRNGRHVLPSKGDLDTNGIPANGVDANNNDTGAEVKKHIIDRMTTVFRETKLEVSRRLFFENKIRRPYFHVFPLEKEQFDNWMKYLNWAVKRVSPEHTVMLFERCLVSCALYEDIWFKYNDFLIAEKMNAKFIRDMFSRACDVHLKASTQLHMAWSLFEEELDNVGKAEDILDRFENWVPGLLETVVAKINLYRRQGNTKKVEQIYVQALKKSADDVPFYSNLSVRFARFLSKVRGDEKAALFVLRDALKKDPRNPSIYMQLIDTLYQKPIIHSKEIINVFNEAIDQASDFNARHSMITRKLQFLQDFGLNPREISATSRGLILMVAEEEAKYYEKQGTKRPISSPDLKPSKKLKVSHVQLDSSVSTDQTLKAAAATSVKVEPGLISTPVWPEADVLQ